MATEESQAETEESLQRLKRHCSIVIKDMADGQVIPFLGAGVNLCNRPADSSFQLGQYLPSGRELSQDLAAAFNYPWNDKENLLRVAWYANFTRKESALYRHLYNVFNADYPFTDVHKFLAKLPRRLRRKGYKNCYQIIVTTNYDDVLERAFRKFGEPFDLVYYVALADDERRGRFIHHPHEGAPEPILDTVEYDKLPIDEFGNVGRTIILKIHGAVSRTGWNRSSFVITEDDYIDYMMRVNPSRPLPKVLLAKMKESSFLFLGYSLSDWNLRVILNSIFTSRVFGANSWAILDRAEEPDEKFWESRDVDFMRARLEDYFAELRRQLAALPKRGGK